MCLLGGVRKGIMSKAQNTRDCQSLINGLPLFKIAYSMNVVLPCSFISIRFLGSFIYINIVLKEMLVHN